MTFEEHKKRTADDCMAISAFIAEVAVKVRAGNMDAFEKFWIEGGTEEGDAKIMALREILLLRYLANADDAE